MTNQNKEELLQEEPMAEDQETYLTAEDEITAFVEEALATSDDPVETAADNAVVQLVQEIKEAIKARDEAEDRYLRAAAEFSNARRRAEVRADSEVRAARERLLNNIIPVVDDFERAFPVGA